MVGYESTLGLAKRCGEVAVVDCSMVAFLRDDCGAIPFVRTNVPAGLISFVCANQVFGVTENPACVGRSVSTFFDCAQSYIFKKCCISAFGVRFRKARANVHGPFG